MTTINQRLTFWCLQHREVCNATRATPEVVCEQGGEVLSENFQRDKWHFCCGCQTFFARADNEAANKICPACTNVATWRYLCDNCQVFSFEAESRLRERAFGFGPLGAPMICPGCLRPPQAKLYEHNDCEQFKTSFRTARAECPCCGKRLSRPQATSYEFPPTYRKSLAEYLQIMKPPAFRAEFGTPEALVALSDGRFWLMQYRDNKQTFVVYPIAPVFGSAQEFNAWQNVFDCEQPGVGEVWLVKPAVAVLDVATQQYYLTQKGKLEVQVQVQVQVQATVPLPATPEPEAPARSFAKPAKPRFSGSSLSSADAPAEIAPSTPTRKPPLPVLIGAGAGGVLLLAAMLYFAFFSAKRTIIAKVKQGQIVTPYGDSAYDVFQKSGLSESDLADLRSEVAPLLKNSGEEIIRQLVNENYSVSATDTAKLFGWLNQLTPSDHNKACEHYFLGRAAIERKDWQAAKQEFQQAIKLTPTWALPANTLGLAYKSHRGNEDYAMARSCFEKAIELEPKWLFPRSNLCKLPFDKLDLLRQRLTPEDYTLGEQACRNVLQLDPNKASAYYYLGKALEGQKNKCGAYEQYRLAIEKAANNTNPGFNVNRLNTAIGQLARQCGGA